MKPRLWIFCFLATLAAFTALAVFTALRIPSYRDPAHDFYAMRRGEYFITAGLTRRQAGGLKLGFAESYPPPEIGAFGNHCISYFGADAFGRPEEAEYFFNYSYANLSLPEIYRFMLRVEARGRLPKKLIIVQITPPHADQGDFIINRGYELPPDMLLQSDPRAQASIAEIADAAWQTLEIRLHEVFNYNTLLLGLAQNSHRARRTGPAVCAETSGRAPMPSWAARLPEKLRNLLAVSGGLDACERTTWGSTLKRDGSFVRGNLLHLVLDQKPVGDTERHLRAGDEREIVRWMRAIDGVGRRSGVTIVFLIPPVYESDRGATVVNRIMDRALMLAPEIAVIDDRNLRGGPELFVEYLHPSPAYFARVAAGLRARGLLSGDG